MRYFTLTTLAAAALLTACGSGAPKTQAELLIGEWDQAEPIVITQNGSALSLREGKLDFRKDGTSESESLLTFRDVPTQIAAYKVASKANYTLNGATLTEMTTNLSVVPIDSNTDSEQMASGLMNMMGAIESSTLTILSIDKDQLVLKDPNSDVVMTYNRD